MKTTKILTSLSLALVFSAASVTAQNTAPVNASPPPSIDPDAIAALDKMGAYLQSLKTFQVQTATTSEDVLDDGQKLQTEMTTDLLVQRPNRSRTKVTSDRQERRFFYDGKTFTLWAPRVNFYATVPAPATLGALADDLTTKFDIELPLVDLFHWGTPNTSKASITSAMTAGLGVVGGAACTQYAFRQPGLDWQIWIQNGDYPLPRKIVITTTTDEARPQFASVYTWNLAPAFNDGAFTFIPPPGSAKISLAEVKAGHANN